MIDIFLRLTFAVYGLLVLAVGVALTVGAWLSIGVLAWILSIFLGVTPPP